MLKKYFILLVLFFSSVLYGMQNDDFLQSSKKKKQLKNKHFLAFLDQNVKTGSYIREKQQKYSTYYATKPTERNVSIETIISAYQTIQGIKRISIAQEDIKKASEIATVKYAISKKICTISLIETEPEFQRQGFGSLLLTDLEQDLRQGGCNEITLIAVEKAQEFYGKHGFIAQNTFGRMTKKLD